jgi:hypothetical protein
MDDHPQSNIPPPPAQAPGLLFEYEPVSGRLLVTSPRGGFVIFHGVPIDAYIWLRFSPVPERYLRERMIGAYYFICSSQCWPKA